MGLPRTELDIGKYIKADEMWYGVDRTEGGVGLKIPIRTELVMSRRNVEAQLILNVAHDFMKFCTRTRRAKRAIKDVEDLEIDMICAENPANAGVRVIEADCATRDPYPVKIYLNKTFGINNLNVTCDMTYDEQMIIQYMKDLCSRYGTGRIDGLRVDLRGE